jgi:hypothetical protein
MDSSCNDVRFSQITNHARWRLVAAITPKFFLSLFWILIRPRELKYAAAIIFISIAFALHGLRSCDRFSLRKPHRHLRASREQNPSAGKRDFSCQSVWKRL